MGKGNDEERKRRRETIEEWDLAKREDGRRRGRERMTER